MASEEQPQNLNHERMGEIFRTAFFPNTPSAKAADSSNESKTELDRIASEYRALQGHHSHEYYRLRYENPEAADIHHGLFYDSMGIAAAIERALREIPRTRMRDRELSTLLHTLGVAKIEDKIEKKEEDEMTVWRFRAEAIQANDLDSDSTPVVVNGIELIASEVEKGTPPTFSANSRWLTSGVPGVKPLSVSS